MPKQTVENRVYLFESLASSYVGAAADLLGSGKPAERARALRALADLAHVACVVADTGALEAGEVRACVLAAPDAPGPRATPGRARRSRAR